MATITLKRKPREDQPARRNERTEKRAPVRGGSKPARPTLAQARTERERREAERAHERPAGRSERTTRPARDDRRPAPAGSRDDRPPGPARSRDERKPAKTAWMRDDRKPAGPARARAERKPAPAGSRDERPAPGDRPARPPRADVRTDARASKPASRREPARGEAATRDDRRDRRPAEAPGRTRDERPARPRPAAPRASEPATRAPARGEPHEALPGSVRLSKRMGELGLASRREADEWIEQGWVRVDGKIVRTLGSRVMPHQHITVDAAAQRHQAAQVTVLLHKPVGYVSGQPEDEHQPAVVLLTPERHWRYDGTGRQFLPEHLRGLAPAGRLDLDSEGLLVLTQDGRVARTLIGEHSEIEKEYRVQVARRDGATPRQALAPQDLQRLRHGLELDGEALAPATVWWTGDDELGFILTEGKKRQIRRMCELVGLNVLRLRRVRIGAIPLGALPPGQWRYLAADESFD